MRGRGFLYSRRFHATCKNVYRVTMWVYDINYDIWLMLLIYPPLTHTPTDDVSLPNHPIKLFFLMPFRVSPIMWFIISILFPSIFHDYPDNRFVKYPLQWFYHWLVFVFVSCCVHLVHMCYIPEVRITYLIIHVPHMPRVTWTILYGLSETTKSPPGFQTFLSCWYW